MGKWAIGIITVAVSTAVAGLVGYYVNSMLKSHPKVVVVGFTPETTIEHHPDSEFHIALYNEGEATAEDCRVVVADAAGEQKAGSRRPFGIKPKGDYEAVVSRLIFSAPGTYKLRVSVKCNNYESAAYPRELKVLPDLKEVLREREETQPRQEPPKLNVVPKQ